ncbi:MAG: hypothetical protein ACRDPR_19910 [Nocardioidaceae bacterium]
MKVLRVVAAAAGVIAFGGATGYLAADLIQPDEPAYGADNNLSFEPQPPLPRKTPVPNDTPALSAAKLDYRTESFTVQTDPNPPVSVRLRVPRGWRFSARDDEPQEVRFVDPIGERALRVESGFSPTLSTSKAMADLIPKLKASQAFENDLSIRSQRTTTVVGTDGETRTISTLTYTFIPAKTKRYVMVRWVATEGDSATVEMSATGLPRDAKALAALLEEATRSVRRTD